MSENPDKQPIDLNSQLTDLRQEMMELLSDLQGDEVGVLLCELRLKLEGIKEDLTESALLQRTGGMFEEILEYNREIFAEKQKCRGIKGLGQKMAKIRKNLISVFIAISKSKPDNARIDLQDLKEWMSTHKSRDMKGVGDLTLVCIGRYLEHINQSDS